MQLNVLNDLAEAMKALDGKKTQFSESIFSQRPASLPFLSAFFAAFPSFTALAFCSHLLFGLFECVSPPALLRLFLWLFLSLSFPIFFCPSPSGLRFWVLLADQQGIKPPPAVCLRLLCRDTCATRATFFSLFPERCIVSACGHQLPLVHSRHNDSKNFSVVDWFCCLLREECDLCEAFEPFWVWAFPEAASVRYGRIRKLHRRKGCEMSEDICVGTPLWLRLWSEWYHLTWILWKCWSFWCGDGYNCFHWAICCRMMHSNLNSVLEAVVLVEASGHAAYRYVIWRLHFRDVRCCHLHFYIYHLQTISELGELVWNRFENAWDVSKGFELFLQGFCVGRCKVCACVHHEVVNLWTQNTFGFCPKWCPRPSFVWRSRVPLLNSGMATDGRKTYL